MTIKSRKSYVQETQLRSNAKMGASNPFRENSQVAQDYRTTQAIAGQMQARLRGKPNKQPAAPR